MSTDQIMTFAGQILHYLHEMVGFPRKTKVCKTDRKKRDARFM